MNKPKFIIPKLLENAKFLINHCGSDFYFRCVDNNFFQSIFIIKVNTNNGQKYQNWYNVKDNYFIFDNDYFADEIFNITEFLKLKKEYELPIKLAQKYINLL